jgi:hypothetical protein
MNLGLSLGLGYRARVAGGGGGGPVPVPETLASGRWVIAYSATAATLASDGATASGVPVGLVATVSGGVLTVSGEPV